MTETIGFIGLGKMGLPMATRMIEAGHALVAYDVQEASVRELEQKGAKPAASPAQVADEAELVFLSLPTPEVVRAVVLGPSGVIAGNKVKTVVDLSTSKPALSIEIAQTLGAKGITLIDSPVSGGVAGAKAGTLAVMVSGPRGTFEKVEDLLKIFGRVFFISEKPGAGQVMKLCNNLMAATSMAIATEAVALGVKSGIDAGVMIDVINVSSGRNNATLDKFPRTILTRTFNQGFSTGLMFKDVRLCLEEAERVGMDLETAKAVRSVWQKAEDALGPDSDHTRIVQLMEERAGVVMK